MIKEAKNGTTEELRIESFDDNVQDIFNHTLDDYNKFKSSKERPLNYVKQLNDYRFKFKKFYETAARSDKKLLKPYLDEISNLLDESEIVNKIKPIKKIDEGKLIDADALNVMMKLIDLGYPSEAASKLIKKYTNFINQELKDGAKPFWIAKLIEDDLVNNKYSDRDDEEELVKESKEICEAAGKKVVNPENVDTIEKVEKELHKLGYGTAVSRALVKDNRKQIIKLLKNGNTAKVVAKIINNQYLNEDYNYYKNPFRQMVEKRKKAAEEKKRNLSKDKFSKKFLELAQTYAGVEDLDIEVAYDRLMSDNRVFELVDSTMSIEDIMDMISAGELLQ
jgi:hypothetical protein